MDNRINKVKILSKKYSIFNLLITIILTSLQHLVSLILCYTVNGRVKIKQSIIRKLQITVEKNNIVAMNNFHGNHIFIKTSGGG